MNEEKEQKKIEKKGIKFWWGYFCRNVKAFFRHPIQYIKGYIKDFKEADMNGKIKKILLTILGLYVFYRMIILVFAVLLVAGMVGSSDYYVLAGQFFDKHGREPENDYELYHDIYKKNT